MFIHNLKTCKMALLNGSSKMNKKSRDFVFQYYILYFIFVVVIFTYIVIKGKYFFICSIKWDGMKCSRVHTDFQFNL